jgi:hypothetical protein
VSVSLFFILLAIATTPLFVYFAPQSGGTLNLSSLTPPLMMGGLGVAVWIGSFGYKSTGVRDVLLSESLCPSCLGLLPKHAEEDGCTVCPECGAAWRMPGGRNSLTGGCEP